MDNDERLALLRRHWEFAATDQDVTHEIYHDDAVLEFPQSGEQFEGVENFREWRRAYPTALAFEMRRVRGEGDLWVIENSIRYGDGDWQPTVSIMEFRGDKVARETIYITETWHAPEWRAKWRSAPQSPAFAAGTYRSRELAEDDARQSCRDHHDPEGSPEGVDPSGYLVHAPPHHSQGSDCADDGGCLTCGMYQPPDSRRGEEERQGEIWPLGNHDLPRPSVAKQPVERAAYPCTHH